MASGVQLETHTGGVHQEAQGVRLGPHQVRVPFFRDGFTVFLLVLQVHSLCLIVAGVQSWLEASSP